MNGRRSRETILVVDDEESVTSRMKYMLEDLGYNGKQESSFPS